MDEEDCEHVWLNGVCQRCNDLQPLDDAATESVEVEVTWRSLHTLRVPKGTHTPATLDELMELVYADPDSGGDITSATAELVDWELRR